VIWFAFDGAPGVERRVRVVLETELDSRRGFWADHPPHESQRDRMPAETPAAVKILPSPTTRCSVGLAP
jgi:hypothetical protein